jgi:chromosome partitioning protein
VLLDCSPAMGVLSLNALVAADRVLLPVSADYLSVEGANRLSAALDVLESRLGKRFVRRIVVTRFDARRRLAFDIHAMLRERFGDQVCDTVIKESVSLAESPMHGQDIFAFARHSQGAADYRALTEELEAGNFFASTAPAPAGAMEGGST